MRSRTLVLIESASCGRAALGGRRPARRGATRVRVSRQRAAPASLPAPRPSCAPAPPHGGAAPPPARRRRRRRPQRSPPVRRRTASGDTQGLTQFETGRRVRAARGRATASRSRSKTPTCPSSFASSASSRASASSSAARSSNIKATVFSPQKVTVAEAYQAFLSILEANGLTVVPHGRFYKIVDSPDAKTGAPVYVAGQAATGEDRYITRIHRLRNVSADDVANVLGHFKSKDGDITVYGPGNLLIITDTGTNIQRMMRILEDVDVGGVGDQIWIEPIHYGVGVRHRARLNEVFDLKGGGAGAGGKGPAAVAAATFTSAKILADDRSNSVVIIATERAYLRILEFIKRLDVPHNGEGEIHVLALQHADAVELTKTLNEIITGAAGRPPTGGGPGKARPADHLRVGREGQRRQGDELDRHHLEPSRLREPPHRHRSARPAAPPGVHRGGHHGPDDRPRAPARDVVSRGRHRERPDQQRSDAPLRRPQSVPIDLAPQSHRLVAQRVRARHPRSGPTRKRELPRHRHLDPGLRHPSQRARPDERRRHPLDAAHPGDRQRPGRDQRRAEHPAADQRRRPGVAAHDGRRRRQPARRVGGARRPRRPGLRHRAAPGHRHEGQDHPAPQRFGRSAPRGDRGDQRHQRAAADRVARRRSRSRSAPRRRSSS